MKIAVFSCRKYSDAWGPFFELFRMFWPGCPYPVHFVVDDVTDYDWGVNDDHAVPDHIYLTRSSRWNDMVAEFCEKYPNEPILVLLEDYFLTSTPRLDMIEEARFQMEAIGADYVRLYPCPGGDMDVGHPYIQRIGATARYRTSLQAAIWNPSYLGHIAKLTKSPHDFEIAGSKISARDNSIMLAMKRDYKPWPIEYICTAIVRGIWQQGAIDFCRQHGIAIDTSRRPIQQVEPAR